MIIHYYDPEKRHATTACGKHSGNPITWPEKQFYATSWEAVDCPECLARKDGYVAPLVDLSQVQTEYDDDTAMTFGKFKGTCLRDVPASYLHWLWTKRPLSDKPLEAYIKKNIPALRREHPDGIWS